LLRIRFTRTGKKGQPSFRIVVAEKAKAVKRKYHELLGNYLPAAQPKKIELKKERIEYWISKGAQPTDSVAALLKSQGFEGMDKFMESRSKKRKKKGEQPEESATSKPSNESSSKPVEEKPVEEKPVEKSE